ncbi:peptide deformylase [Paracidovorax citrulli]|nr:peptide deformylase [Paracidovorax citrulli]
MATHRGAELTTSTAPQSAIMAVALHFARRLTRPPSAQLRSMEPKSGCRHSQACSRGELRAAAQPAMRTKTVVGRPGTKMPTMPRPRLNAANASSSQRTGAGSGACAGGGGRGSVGGAGMGRLCLPMGRGDMLRVPPDRRRSAPPPTSRAFYMAIHDILKMGDERLLRTARPVAEFGTPSLLQLVQDMRDTMRAVNGAGLAAPQIGVDLQVVIFGSEERNPRYPDRPLVPPTVLVNPRITPLGGEEEEDWEGCLSVPGLRGVVPRWSRIHYRGFDEHGAPIDRTVEGFHARVVQHECDHLVGKLYPMRIRDFSRFGYADVLFPDIAEHEDD